MHWTIHIFPNIALVICKWVGHLFVNYTSKSKNGTRCLDIYILIGVVFNGKECTYISIYVNICVYRVQLWMIGKPTLIFFFFGQRSYYFVCRKSLSRDKLDITMRVIPWIDRANRVANIRITPIAIHKNVEIFSELK